MIRIMSEPDWTDKEIARRWLERRYVVGNDEKGSPFFQYMNKEVAKGNATLLRESHLTSYERLRWEDLNGIENNIACPPQNQRLIFYPEYGPGVNRPGPRKEPSPQKTKGARERAKSNRDRKSASGPNTAVLAKKPLKDRPSSRARYGKPAQKKSLLMQIDPGALGQQESRVKTLRQQIGGRKHGKTGTTYCEIEMCLCLTCNGLRLISLGQQWSSSKDIGSASGTREVEELQGRKTSSR